MAIVGRKTTQAFLFCDLRGYTSFLAARGAVAAGDLLDRYRSLVRGAVERHAGAEIRTEGDSFYVVFSSVSSAVECALEIARAATDPGRPGGAIHVGIGIAAGESIETGDGLVGAAINLAARLCAIARPGQVLVSDTVRSLTETVVDASFAGVGRRRLKGFADPVQVVAVRPRTDAMPVRAARRSVELRRLTTIVAAAAVLIVVAAAALLSRSPSPDLGTPTESVLATVRSLPLENPTGGGDAAAASPGKSAPIPPSADATASSAPKPTLGRTPVAFPGASEQQILDGLPADVARDCGRAEYEEAAAAGFATQHRTIRQPHGGVISVDAMPRPAAAVVCRPVASGLTTVHIFLFPAGSDRAREALGGLIGSAAVPVGSCPPAAPARSDWSIGGTRIGTVVCLIREARPFIYWSNEAGETLGWASREDTRYQALWDWWISMNRFLH